jgi:hypothetical protein
MYIVSVPLQNWTTWLLADPLVRSHCGHISELYPAPVVFPATREVMEGYKVVSRLLLPTVSKIFHHTNLCS